MSVDPCTYCGREMLANGPHGTKPSKEHIIPRVLGDFGRFNIVRACNDCNHLKNSRTPPEMLQLAAMMEAQARRWREMAEHVEELVDERGLLAPWRLS